MHEITWIIVKISGSTFVIFALIHILLIVTGNADVKPKN